MAYFKQGGGERGGGRFDRERGPSRFGGRDSGRPVTMHKATCAECGNTCEVPFRPMNGKPVYCKDCFAKMGGPSRDREEAPRRDFRSDTSAPARPRPEYAPAPANNQSNQEVTKQLQEVNVKLERLIKAIEGKFTQPAEKKEEVAAEAPVKKSKKTSKK